VSITARGMAVMGAAAIAAAAALAVTAPAGASAGRVVNPGSGALAAQDLHLSAMPAGTVTLGRSRGRLTVRTAMFGLTAGSSHAVSLQPPGRVPAISFTTLTANGVGQANATLSSGFTGRLAAGSRLVVRMGTGPGRVAREPIAVTTLPRHPAAGPRRLTAVEVSPSGRSYGTPRGRATISYSARRHTLTVTVSASGVTPGPHAAHIHLGSCQRQGPVLYMLRDLVAGRHGRIVHAVRVFTNVTAPIPATGWYLNIHQGNSGDILSNGQPTIFFRPLLCANIRGGQSASGL
jgi:hypothetical protein